MSDGEMENGKKQKVQLKAGGRNKGKRAKML